MAGALPIRISGWMDLCLDWLVEDATSRERLLRDVARSINAALGRTSTTPLDAAAVEGLRASLHLWLTGAPLLEIERALAGDPDSDKPHLKRLPRAREFVATVVPRGFAYIIGVVARMAEELKIAELQADLDPALLSSLSPAVRRGFDTLGKLDYATSHRELRGRVEAHRGFDALYSFDALDDLNDGNDPT